MVWRIAAGLYLALGAFLVLAAFGAPPAVAGDKSADTFLELKRCLALKDRACLAATGRALSADIDDPRERSLMLGRFALVDWASGDRRAGNTRFLRAWAEAAKVETEGCYDRIETLFALEDLASGIGHRTAARFILRGLLREASDWGPDPSRRCERPSDEVSWLERMARRQFVLNDANGLSGTLDLAYRWAGAPAEARPPVAPSVEQSAALLAAFDRKGEATKLCDRRKQNLLQALPEGAELGAEADARWRGLACYRAAGLTSEARLAYQEYAAAKAAALGVKEDAETSVPGAEDALEEALWDMVQDVSWNDPILFPYTPDFQAKSPRACFERPTARCLMANGINYVESRNRSRRRADNWSAGSLDGFARFLVGSGEDPAGFDAQLWFVGQTDDAPVEDLSMLVGNAIRTGDLIWARTIFYAWYSKTGESFFKELQEPRKKDPPKRAQKGDRDEADESWPLHVAWKIASVIADLSPAFEPEELAEFGEKAWTEGVQRLPPLRDLPRIELIDADERSGTHLLNLCSRNAFSAWAAELFTKAHVPVRAAEARALLPEAARDCAFARRSVGPIVAAAGWFAGQGDKQEAEALLTEAADRLTRPHYHVYPDTDPFVGGAAVAASALGLYYGLTVPAPYDEGL